MSKKKNKDNDPYYCPNFWTNFLGGSLDDDEDDEDYCFVEDKIENFSHYKNDIIPYDFSIPKKEIDDVIHDGELYCNHEDILNNSMLSIGSRRRHHLNPISKFNQEDNIGGGMQHMQYTSSNENLFSNTPSYLGKFKDSKHLNLNPPIASSNLLLESPKNLNYIFPNLASSNNRKRKPLRKKKHGRGEYESASERSRMKTNSHRSHQNLLFTNSTENELNLSENNNFFTFNNNPNNASFTSSLDGRICLGGKNLNFNNQQAMVTNFASSSHSNLLYNRNNPQNNLPNVQYGTEPQPETQIPTNNPLPLNPQVLGKILLPLETPELIKLLLKQFDFFLQLLIQNVLLSNDQAQVYRCYIMLYSFYSIRQRIINMNLAKFPEYSVKFNFCRIFNQNKDIKLRPQLSFFQAPLLDILNILVRFIKKTFSVDEVNLLMKEFFPFTNPLYMPIKGGNSSFVNFENNFNPGMQNNPNQVSQSDQNKIQDEIETMINLNKSSADANNDADLNEIQNNFNKNGSIRENSNLEENFSKNEKKDISVSLGLSKGNSLPQSHSQSQAQSNENSQMKITDQEKQIDELDSSLSEPLNTNLIDENKNKTPCTTTGIGSSSNPNRDFLGKKRKKFDHIYDNLLMIGLLQHGKKNIELIQQLWVNSRSNQEIRHRIKNLTCKRAPENVIKKWKNLSEAPLNKEEFFAFLKGLQWFGMKKRFGAISRYFIPDRSPEFLESTFESLHSLKLFSQYDNPLISSKEEPVSNITYSDQIEKTPSFSVVSGSQAQTTTKKRKNHNNHRELTPIEKIHFDLAREYESEIMKIINLSESVKNCNNSENNDNTQCSLSSFFSPEQTFEKFEIEENFPKDRNMNPSGSISGKGLNYISTRSRNNAYPYSYYNTLPQQNKAFSRGRSPVFDFHIKKIDDSSYEKIVID